MKINLRKANALQLAITQAINEKPFKLTVEIGRFDDPAKKHSEATEELGHAMKRNRRLRTALYVIRKAAARASMESGIADLLTDLAYTEKLIESVKVLADAKEFAPTTEKLAEQWNDLREEKVNPSAYRERREHVSVPVVAKETAEEAERTVRDARRTKQNISDKILELNVKTEFEIPEEYAEIFRENGLI